ncbi:MAG TPA: lytic transglycosylase domain-containing protein [Polyangiales bacterium]|nr:lytic transglycosylase domain-containing protein [Polyangiales bacterium]
MQALPPSIAALVNAAAIRFGVRPAFARAIAWVESRGNQSAVSPAGAIGVMQLMPATARGLGVDATQLVQNIEGGVRLLASHLRDFSEELAAAAYNGGTVQLYKDPSQWPAETRAYVPAVMARAALEDGSDPQPSSTLTDIDAPSGGTGLVLGLATLGFTVAIVFAARKVLS